MVWPSTENEGLLAWHYIQNLDKDKDKEALFNVAF